MVRIYSESKRAASARGGSVLLIMLVAIVIGMLIYFIDIRALFGPSLDGQSNSPASRPWLQEDLILGPDKIVEMPESPKPEINEKIKLVAMVSRDAQSRGSIEITFDVNGRVKGGWACNYTHGDQDYSYAAAFGGNIDITTTYVADGNKDKSLLYFITKGKYVQKSVNINTEEMTSEEGDIYVTGYLAPDYSAKGLITITTDRKWSATYDWRTQ